MPLGEYHSAKSARPYCFSFFHSVVRDMPSLLAVAARFPPFSRSVRDNTSLSFPSCSGGAR